MEIRRSEAGFELLRGGKSYYVQGAVYWARPDGAALRFLAPEEAGDYRVFVIARDGRGNAATANIPFHVEPAVHANLQRSI